MSDNLKIKPVTVDLGDPEYKQTITIIKGLLAQQERYTANAVRECMRLRKIISRCEQCRNEANRGIEG